MKAGPKPAPPAAPKRRTVEVTSVPQETFAEPARALAAKLGWDGDPEWVGNDITVRDAQAYIQKVMHEHHQAGARGEDQPDYKAACLHLAVDNADEQAAIDAALKLAFDSGVGMGTKSVPVKNASMDAEMVGKGDAILGKLAGR